MKKEDIIPLGIFSHIDIHFAALMEKLAQTGKSEVFLAAALVSCHKRDGHICLDLSKVQKKYAGFPVSFPNSDVWRKKLEHSGVVGSPGEYKPLILDHKSRMYLYRYWKYQETLADLIGKRISSCFQAGTSASRSQAPAWERETGIDPNLLNQGLDRLFSANHDKEFDSQKFAAKTALTRKFCVISGGPGTGKTTTVAKILALFTEQAKGRELKIALAAPTGKAAARLQEAIIESKAETLSKYYSAQIIDAIPESASTLHRLLKTIPNSPYFRHNAKNPLLADMVVIDEASMVDMALMAKLIQALPLNCRLILLGDKDQLASVEAGSVLGDICNTGKGEKSGQSSLQASSLADCIVQLQKNWRFKEDSGIHAVSRAVNKGNIDNELIQIRNKIYHDIVWKDLPHSLSIHHSEFRDTVIRGFESYLRCLDDPVKVFEKFDQFRILCALRHGPYGSVAVNTLAEHILRKANLIKPDKTWYPGRPVMITSNDYNLQLFNGDIGICLPDPETDNELRFFFPRTDGTQRKLNPIRLPGHETVYAMTVHKSQGSEFDKVLLLLTDRDSPILTRELIYTGITRAKEHVELWGKEDVFRLAVSRRIERISGLRDALWDEW